MMTVTLFVRWSSLSAGFVESRFPRVLWFTLSHCCYPRRPLLGGGVTLTACHSSAASGVELQTKVREDFTITDKAQLALCLNSFLIMKAVGASNQVKAIVGTFSVIGKSSRTFICSSTQESPVPCRSWPRPWSCELSDDLAIWLVDSSREMCPGPARRRYHLQVHLIQHQLTISQAGITI